MEGDLAWGGEHTIQHTDDVLQNYTPATYKILLVNVIPTNSIKKKKTTFMFIKVLWISRVFLS